MSWQKSPPALVARFDAVLARFPDTERRTMFGCPCAFVGGHMVTGLHEHRWFARLPADERAVVLAADGAEPFAPMPGRPMREYVVLPPSWADDAIAPWIERAVAHVRTLPPRPTRTR